VPLGAAVPSLAAYGDTMASGLKHLGIKTHVCDGKFLPTTIASCLNQALQQGADAVVTGYVDYKMVPTAIDKVVANKIPLLVAGQANNAGSKAGKLLGFQNTDSLYEKQERLAIDQAIVEKGGKADIVYIGSSDGPSQKRWNEAAADEAKTKCPDCKFVGLEYNTPQLPKVPSQISSALIKNPDTNYVVSGEDGTLPPVTQGIQSAGFTNKVKISSVDGLLSALQKVKAGAIVSDVGASPAYVGWGFADGIIRMMAGEQPVEYLGGIRVFNKDNVGGLQLTPAQFATNAWYGPASYEQSFLDAWGAK
jgi:ribose transport system substrate-binding protein